MIRWILSGFGMIFTAATLGLFAMALTVGAVLWMYGRDLPDTEALAQYAPPTISRIYSGEGNLMDEFAKERRVFAPAEMIPEQVKEAFISAEDKNFYNHKGYDPRGIAVAAFQAVQTRGETVRGASTITQQVMKNFLLGGERSAERKIKEIILSSRIEETLSKEQILELYLNEIYLGANSYGVTAAAQVYFNKPLEDLDLAETAYLAALPQRPATLHPVRNYDDAIWRRNYVLGQMLENGYITEVEMEAAVAEPLKTVQSGDFASFRSGLPPRDYFTDEIRRQLSESFGEEEFFSGGLAIRATVDSDLQKVAAKALRSGLEKYDRARGLFEGPAGKIEPALLGDQTAWREALSKLEVARDIEGWRPAVILEMEGGNARIGVEGIEGDTPQTLTGESVRWARPRLEGSRRARNARAVDDLVDVGDVVYVSGDGDNTWKLRQIPALQGGFMAMDVNTGRVLAMQGGFSYQDSVFNRATQATRQPGSSFKPLVYASALDSGYSPATIVIDAPIEIAAGDGTVWRPKNASNRFYGPTPLRTGIERSRNLMTVRLAHEIGMDTVARYSEKFGVYDRLEPYLANALGSQETTLLRMVSAYAMFANGGERVEPTLVDRVQDRWGETIFRHDKRECEECQVASLDPGMAPRIVSNRERVIDAITAYQLTSMMRGVVDRGTAARTVNLPIPIAGKTGTTNDAKDVWFIGFSSNIVAGCYMGYDQPRSMGRGASGGGMCGPVFNEFMNTAIAAYGGGRFTVPPGGEFVKIDRFSGARLPNDSSGEYVVAEYFRVGEEPWYGSPITGGFAMGSNLPMFTREDLGLGSGTEVVTSDGNRAIIPEKANVGTVSAGGLY